MSRRIAALKKVSLADFAEGWDDCYATVRLATLQDYREITTKDFTGAKNLEVVDYEVQVVKEHFVGGKIRVLNDQGEPELQDMQAEDVECLPGLADHLYIAVLGLNLDPKDLRTQMAQSSTSELGETPSTSLSTTKTPSSTESEASQPTS